MTTRSRAVVDRLFRAKSGQGIFGFVTADDGGADALFTVEEGAGIPLPGDVVECDLVITPKGRRALNIRVLRTRA
jgi:cold shock CspA family protein